MKNSFIGKKNRRKVSISAIALLFVLLCVSVGTAAYIWVKTNTAKNQFTPGNLSCSVSETVEDKKQKNVTIKNEGNINGYIRAKILVNWEDGNGTVYSVAPIEGENEDYVLTLASSGWTEINGYYYYNGVVKPGESTSALIVEAKANYFREVYDIEIDIVAQIIQTEPADTVNNHWKVKYSNGRWSAVGSS